MTNFLRKKFLSRHAFEGQEAATVGWDGEQFVATEGPYVYPQWFGAEAYPPETPYADMVDSATAIQNAIDTAKALGHPLVLSGRFRVDSTIQIDTNADCSGAEFVCNDDSLEPLVRIGASGEDIRYLNVVAPIVIQDAKPAGSWTGTSVGIELVDLRQSTVFIPLVRGFSVGLLVTGDSAGTALNNIHLGRFLNNQVSIKLSPRGVNGWANNNVFIGGTLDVTSEHGTDVVGVRQILVEQTGTFEPNNNVWINTALESNAPEYHLESIGGQDNRWLMCRWEAATPKVFWNQFDGANPSLGNVIDGGYNAQNIVFTHSGSSFRNSLYAARGREIRDGSDPFAFVRWRQQQGNTVPALVLFGATKNPLVSDPDTQWAVRMAANFIECKDPTVDSGPVTVRLDSVTGRIRATGGLEVGNSAAAIGPVGSVTGKLEIFNDSGVSLGFVPIYATID